MARTGPAHKVKAVKPNKRYQSMMAASVQQQKKKTGGYATPVPATRKQETGSYYGTTGSRGYVSGKVMPAHTTQKDKAASAASTLSKQAAAYKAAHRRNDMAGMISAAGGNMAKLKSIHAAAYPKAKTGKAAGASKGSASRSRLRFGGR